MNDFCDVASLDSLAASGQLKVTVGTTHLLLCHDEITGRVWAMQNRCPHAFQPLDGGVVNRGTIQCPKHGACFDLSTGRAINSVTTRPLSVHATEVREGRIWASPTPLPASR